MLAPARYDGRDRICLPRTTVSEMEAFREGLEKRRVKATQNKGTRSCTGGIALIDKDFEYDV